MLQDWFLAHPREAGESYFEHQRTALRFSLILFQAALACFVHALVPGLLQRSASRCVAELHDCMMRRAAPAAHLIPTPGHSLESLRAAAQGSYRAEHA